MQRRLAALAIGCFSVSPLCAQEIVTPEQALDELKVYFESNLPKFGRFTVNVTGDWAHAGDFRPTVGSNRSVEGQHQLRDVSFDDCTLRYTATLQASSDRVEPLRWQLIIPLWNIDITKTRVQRYELPAQLRATNTRWEVNIQAVADGFTLIDADQAHHSVWRQSIPIDRKNHAQEVEVKLRDATLICRAVRYEPEEARAERR